MKIEGKCFAALDDGMGIAWKNLLNPRRFSFGWMWMSVSVCYFSWDVAHSIIKINE